tara:strand:+ start:273 stop:1631 length:1359 start_codon:yes stop_codon:yes gene_type:complete
MKIKNICCIGAGYVGGPSMAVIALKCPHLNIMVVDDNEKKIDSWNGNLDNLPVYEPGLKEIIKKVRGKNLFFSKNIDHAIMNSEIIFMAVNTPTKKFGKGKGKAADLSFVESCAKRIAHTSESNKIVIEKSTLPVRTAEKIKEILITNNKKNKFEVLSNPEFLAEGTAIQDLYKSDRVLIGGDSTSSGQKAVKILVDIYLNWIPKEKILTTNIWSSELSKLASNAMLAQRISSINSLSALSEKTGAKINEVSRAIGMDHRIGPHFLKASPGFGGSCFKKDILNLVYLCEYYGLEEVAEYWYQVVKLNNYQRSRIIRKINSYISNNNFSKELIILGWTYKKNTNDSRESSSIFICYELLKSGYKLTVYDPKVNLDAIIKNLIEVNNEEKYFDDGIIKNNINTLNNLSEIMNFDKLIIILTEWDEFKQINNFSKKLRIFDFRNIIDFNKTIFSL